MFKILQFLVISFFFFILFSFSHLFYLFGSDFTLSIFGRGGYEGIKSSIVLIYGALFLIWLCVYLFKYKIYKAGKNVLISISIITILLVISSLLSVAVLGSIIGLSEKFHGLLFYISLLIFFLSVYFGYEKEDYKKTLNYIFIFSGLIYVYGFIQYLGLDPLGSLYDTRVSITRASSFFGNANYLAGYALMLLPLSKFIETDIIRKIFIGISFLILIATGSYFGIFLGFLYFLYLMYSFNKNIFIFSLVSFVILSAFVFNSLSVEKMGSMLARPYIWQSSLLAIIDTPKTILFGYGPDTLQLVFNNFKVEELLVYETNYYTADRTHNIFLDLIYFFGILGGLIIIYFLLKGLFKTNNRELQFSLLFFLIFFSFNVPISIHFLLILFIISGVYKKHL